MNPFSKLIRRNRKPASENPEQADQDGYGPLVFQKNQELGPASGTDIIFIHGLRGSRAGTWTKDGVCWPRDLLLHDVDDIRVILWGYDSSVANATRYASLQSVFGHAESLSFDLRMLRKGITRRLLFVCHSLGGIVAKEALIFAALNSQSSTKPYLGEMLKSTIGVVFFGTPHRGSSAQSFGRIAAKVASVTFRSPNTQLLDILRTDSHYLEQQRKSFVAISRHLHIVCIREESRTKGIMVVPASSAFYDGENVELLAIPANHSGIVKFRNRQEIGYQRARFCIDKLCSLTPEMMSTVDPIRVNETTCKDLFELPQMQPRDLGVSSAHEMLSWVLPDDPVSGASTTRPPGLVSWPTWPLAVEVAQADLGKVVYRRTKNFATYNEVRQKLFGQPMPLLDEACTITFCTITFLEAVVPR